ncbi:MAG TPA: hypothetical protein VNU48_13435 [Burkholderiaceae bacterium]|nr:hypothetical protein [Burkholderiaceae bacterium]
MFNAARRTPSTPPATSWGALLAPGWLRRHGARNVLLAGGAGGLRGGLACSTGVLLLAALIAWGQKPLVAPLDAS